MAKLIEVFDNILEGSEDDNIDVKNPSIDSIKWFREKIDSLNLSNDIENRKLVRDERGRLTDSPALGKMYLMRYVPKTKTKLPFWDEFPLIIPVRAQTRPKEGFYAMNLHYLDPQLRGRFLRNLLDFRSNDNFNNSTSLEISYNEMKVLSKLRPFKPTFKKYLINRVASKFLEIHSTEWMMAPFLPLEEFHKADKRIVWSDSRRKI